MDCGCKPCSQHLHSDWLQRDAGCSCIGSMEIGPLEGFRRCPTNLNLPPVSPCMSALLQPVHRAEIPAISTNRLASIEPSSYQLWSVQNMPYITQSQQPPKSDQYRSLIANGRLRVVESSEHVAKERSKLRLYVHHPEKPKINVKSFPFHNYYFLLF